MTDFQKQTKQEVENIQALIEKTWDFTTFPLVPELRTLREQLSNLQKNCDHIYESSYCIICGKQQEEEDK